MILLLLVIYTMFSTRGGDFADCYPQARWNGREFVPTGQTICLGGK